MELTVRNTFGWVRQVQSLVDRQAKLLGNTQGAVFDVIAPPDDCFDALMGDQRGARDRRSFLGRAVGIQSRGGEVTVQFLCSIWGQRGEHKYNGVGRNQYCRHKSQSVSVPVSVD